jgi:hypothetical protein
VNGSFICSDTAGAATLGTGLLAAQLLSLEVGGGLHGSGGQAAGGGDRDGLHLRQIDVQPWSFFAEGAAGDDSSPTSSQLGNGLEFLRCQLP